MMKIILHISCFVLAFLDSDTLYILPNTEPNFFQRQFCFGDGFSFFSTKHCVFHWIQRTHFSSLVMILPRKCLVASLLFNDKNREPDRWWGIHWPSLDTFPSLQRGFMIQVWFVWNSFADYCEFCLGFFNYNLQKLNIDRTLLSRLWEIFKGKNSRWNRPMIGMSIHLKFNFHRENKYFLLFPLLKSLQHKVSDLV